ncbi:GNAT family N-acetyltransferase [Nisaea sp.]|uniref:GNAT family N-acetyltransferase n=1 Tax=Nisaea sp. TaxID=2024842 RepID=UPI002B2707EB|nr:GNAT family N-acetyltransferase [Nisaea sp.]
MPITKDSSEIRFVRLPEIALGEIAEHMSDPRVVEHMPLAIGDWDQSRCKQFVAYKEEFWRRDGLGHWAILRDDVYAGWGGFQKEAGEWDFGLVLKPDHFGLGIRVAGKALAVARSDTRIPFVTFLLPLSRKHFRWTDRLGAERVGEVDYAGSVFRKYRLGTE